MNTEALITILRSKTARPNRSSILAINQIFLKTKDAILHQLIWSIDKLLKDSETTEYKKHQIERKVSNKYQILTN